MRYILNERRIIDVYVEHVYDEPDILDLLEDGTVLQEPVDEGIMDIGEGCATQNSQPAPNFHEAPETAAKGDVDETDAMHGDDEDSGEGCVTQYSQPAPNFHEAPETTEGDADEIDVLHGGAATQKQDQEKNDHDDEDLLDIVPSDADDEEVLESIRNKRNIKPVQVQEKMQMVLDQAAQSMTPLPHFENSEDEFEVSSDDSSEYNVANEHELEEEEEEDVRTTKSSDLWFNPSWTTIWFEVGMRFEHVAQFKEAIATYQIQKGCRLKLVESDPTRQRIHCVDQQCNWSIFASFDKNDKTFKVKTYCKEHTCFRSLKSDMVGLRVLAKHHKNRIFADLQIKISEVVRLSHLELGIHVSRDKCKLAKERIIKEVKETHTKEFAQLIGYVEELLRLSPQSNVQIDSEPPTTPEGKPTFKGIYVCLEICKKGFLLGCRPVIGVDACFLKGMFKGTLLAAVARDGNNPMSMYEGQFNKNMEEIRNLTVEGHDALKSIPPELWCKAFFDTSCKYDVVDNNMNETFNNWIMDARKVKVGQLEKMTKEGGQITWSLCKQPGHNKRGCPKRLTESESGQSDGLGRKKKHRFGEYINSPELNPQGLQGETTMRHTHPSQFHKAQPP
ncbi:hypothetical protein SLEP1_g27688 [Rubroshorea leprosula]|uniref:Transposase MuDR plant domain-containing protein n=1 Tax=Rubroshorea leprosula TaxID=152421 RepID=A0AAV5K0I4_9ROSI|nr:hypothetical protein SLEP1_g27688 [Rubroshorea leprosula]